MVFKRCQIFINGPSLLMHRSVKTSAVAAASRETFTALRPQQLQDKAGGRAFKRVYRRGGTRGPTHLIVENLRLKRAGRRCSRALVPLKMAGGLRGSTRGPTHQFVEVLRLERRAGVLGALVSLTRGPPPAAPEIIYVHFKPLGENGPRRHLGGAWRVGGSLSRF